MIADENLNKRIQQALARTGIEAIVTTHKGVVHLDGLVDSAEMREAASDVTHEIALGAVIDNRLEVIPILSVPEPLEAEPERDQLAVAVHVLGEESEREARERQREASKDAEGWPRDPGSAEPQFAPTDPVVRQGPHGLEILGGFAATSLDVIAVEEPDVNQFSGHARGDPELADDVIRELAEDAATADLDVHVRVRDGVVRLTGAVASLDDADVAEEVAARIPGVVEVDERLEIATGP